MVASLVAAPFALAPQARAQQSGPGWFIPNQQSAPAAGRAPTRAAPRREPAPAPLAEPAPGPIAAPGPDAGGGIGFGGGPGPDQQEADQQPLPNVPEAPVPDLPALPRGSSPPAAVVGVLGVPEVMRASTAAQQVERVLGERRDKLGQDAQKEQAAWREMQQSLANQRGSLNPDQVRAKERELQERITNAQKQFRDRNLIIQEAAQYSLSQIERTLIAVIRQVSESRGMNLVLHRTQVALNVNEFDITEAVTAELNKVLPEVKIPPDGVSPATFAQANPAPTAAPVAAQAPAPAAGPAAAPAPAPAPAAPAKRR
jgi:Skp family chaperone for outer membrane proteins